LAGPTLSLSIRSSSLFFGCRGAKARSRRSPGPVHPRLYLSWPATALSTPVMSAAPWRSRAQRLELRGFGFYKAQKQLGGIIDESGRACRCRRFCRRGAIPGHGPRGVCPLWCQCMIQSRRSSASTTAIRATASGAVARRNNAITSQLPPAHPL